MGEAIRILLVEDSPGDVRLTQEAFKVSPVHTRIDVVTDGEAALRFLRRQGEHVAAPVPDLVLLDLNLPRLDGREVLAQIKSDPRLRRIPVIILTTSDAESDILRTYDLHANGYVVKPVTFAGFMEAVRAIEGFWLTLARLPPPGPAPT